MNGGVARTSTDFWPTKPETHGLHVWTNAAVGLWFGEFVLPDWDMFQSGLGDGWAAFHAAARAISGGPVYVSDKPGESNFELLRKLVCPDGRVLRCDGPGRICRESLFSDPTKEDVLLKVWNRNGERGIVGLFNCRYGVEGKITGTVSPADVAGMDGAEFVIWLHQAGVMRRMAREEKLDVALGQAGWEIATVAPIVGGVAAIGLLDKLNSGGAVMGVKQNGTEAAIQLRDGGLFGAWCERRPLCVEVDGEKAAFHWDEKLLRVYAAKPGQCVVKVRWN